MVRSVGAGVTGVSLSYLWITDELLLTDVDRVGSGRYFAVKHRAGARIFLFANFACHRFY